MDPPQPLVQLLPASSGNSQAPSQSQVNQNADPLLNIDTTVVELDMGAAQQTPTPTLQASEHIALPDVQPDPPILVKKNTGPNFLE
ncbi:hypothetical protein N7466_009946 [Penicillium verhagenii]|uniref:uncharacterized protein n=1 Tax=Penicillium verhagenii TaxID=1562060 RepID=UPI002545B6F1|nr:uncharacterized protein N7466_009946 [Penicillium verhagenii]KAJ5919003.1 hypothetical protein N7466_009946 [Penicillium verhagenii]